MLITLDNHPLEVPDNSTILDAARQVGLHIPTLCHRDPTPNAPPHDPLTSCLVCLVKLLHPNGSSRLIPSCATKVTPGMVIESQTPEVLKARQSAVELLLSEHAGECLPPCELICPAHVEIETFLRQIATGDDAAALATIKQSLPFPGIVGRICPAMCENGCRRKQREAAVSICQLERFAADRDLAQPTPYRAVRQPRTSKRIAIIGAGPAGLTAAYYLALAGHDCTILDDHPEAGGNLRYAIGPERLDRAVLNREITLLLETGITFQPHTKITDLTPLTATYDAVLVAIGGIKVVPTVVPTPSSASAEDMGCHGQWGRGPAGHDAQKQAPENPSLPPAQSGPTLNLPTTKLGLQVDRETLATPQQKVFAAGAALGAHQHTVRAIADGQFAAAVINAFILQKTLPRRHLPWSTKYGALAKDELAYLLSIGADSPRLTPPTVAPNRDISWNVLPPPAISATQARTEATRCLHCGCLKAHDCRLRQESIAVAAESGRYRTIGGSPAGGEGHSGGGGGGRRPIQPPLCGQEVIFDVNKCINCGLCVQITAPPHLPHQETATPPSFTFTARGYATRLSIPLHGTLDDALGTHAKECVENCPTAALAWKKRM